MKKLLLPFFFAGTIIMILVMAKTGAVLKTAFTPLGIIDLEFAYNASKAGTVINNWASLSSTDLVEAAKFNTCLDFLFLFFYAGFLMLAAEKIAANSRGWFAKAGNLAAKGALLAGFLDILENAGMLITLHGHISSTITFLTTFFSALKWALVLPAALYAIIGFPALGYRVIKHRSL